MPSITILVPAAGATVARPFPTSGTYEDDNPNPSINVYLEGGSGVVLATIEELQVGGGNWSGVLNPRNAVANTTVYAEITGTTASDSHGNITVN